MASQPGSVDAMMDQVHAFVETVIERRMNQVEQSLQGMSNDMTTWMQFHAPWQDDTGRARQSLWAGVTQSVQRDDATHWSLEYGFGFGDYIDYAEDLETQQAGRYSILRPTEQQWKPRIVTVANVILMGEGSLG